MMADSGSSPRHRLPRVRRASSAANRSDAPPPGERLRNNKPCRLLSGGKVSGAGLPHAEQFPKQNKTRKIAAKPSNVKCRSRYSPHTPHLANAKGGLWG